MEILNAQKSYIIKNMNILDIETKKSILNLVMMEIGPSVVSDTIGMKCVNIDLDEIQKSNTAVITHIYNMVMAKVKSLNQPVGSSSM